MDRLRTHNNRRRARQSKLARKRCFVFGYGFLSFGDGFAMNDPWSFDFGRTVTIPVSAFLPRDPFECIA